MDRKLTGVYIRGNSIQIKFQYKGVRCSETLKLSPKSKSNLKYAENMRATILFEIERGKFNYAEHFPNSKKARLYSNNIPLTVKQELNNYFDLKRRENLIEHSSLNQYRKNINTYLIPEFGDFQITDITSIQITTWLEQLPIANKTKNNIITPLRGMFREAFLDDKIKTNPLDRVRNLKIIKNEPHPFSPEEIIKILSSYHGQKRNFFQCQFSTGLRPSESISLLWSDIDWDRLLVSVNKAFVDKKLKGTKTNSGKRFVTIREPVLQALLNQMKFTFGLSDYIFHNPNNDMAWKSDSAVRKTWVYALKRAGVEYRNPYQTRHTFASMMLTVGEDRYKVMAEMGHKTFHELENTYARFMHGIVNQDNRDFNGVWSQICHEVSLSD